MRPEFTLCRDTGIIASDGICPVHHGDNCLSQFVQRFTGSLQQKHAMLERRGAIGRAEQAVMDAFDAGREYGLEEATWKDNLTTSEEP